MSIAASFIVDNLISRGYQRWNIRRIAHVLASVLPGAILVMCSYVDDSKWAVALMTLSICLCGIRTCGIQSVFVEVSPTLSNLLYAISNTIATLPGIIAPIFSGYVLGDSPGNKEWKYLFYVAFIMHVVGAWTFCCYGAAHKIPALNKK